MFLSSCLKADYPGRATCFTLKHLSRYFYILFSVNWFRVFCSWYLSSILLLLHKMFHSALPLLLSISTVCSITVCACRYLAFPQPQAEPLCCISQSGASGECSVIILPHLPCVLHSHCSHEWAKQCNLVLRISLSWSSLLLHPFQQLLQTPAISSLCFCPSLIFLLWPVF